MENKKIAIDLLWIKPGKNGGTESLYRNVLDGFTMLKNNNNYVLICSSSNYQTFEHYLNDKRFEMLIVNVKSDNLLQRLMWTNFRYWSFLKKHNLDFIFFPTYAMPFFKNKSIKSVTGIMDIQAKHYPEYFHLFERIYFSISWKRDFKVANKVFTISNYTRDDIEKYYNLPKNTLAVVYATCEITDPIGDFKKISKEFNIKKDEYYFTVSSLLPHKNLITLIKTMKLINDTCPKNKKKLVISGTGGKEKNKLLKMIDDYNLNDRIVITRYVSNEERNSLYKNASIFLFPSIFEGFGMPPIEAMMLGTKVITTKTTSLPEVTKNKAYYIENPFDEEEWKNKIIAVEKKKINSSYSFDEYKKEKIAKDYLDLFEEVRGKYETR